MYQTLYRKYRPKNFNDVVGQNFIIKTLKNEILNNRINHAYLFTGPRGTGKTSTAKIFAKMVNCSNFKDGNPCDECVNCTQTNQNQNIDIIEIDAASNNGIDEIRELKSKVNLVPSNGKYKVYIIDEVHMLTIGAFNALLKTLEEPPAHVIFILATTDPHKIPVTILSRCQRFDFKKISLNDLTGKIKNICEIENIKIDEQAVFEISRLADGGMRDALSMLEQVSVFSNDIITIADVHEINGTLSQEQIENFFVLLFKRNISQVFNLIDEFDENGKNIIKLTEEMIYYLRNILLYKTTPEYFENEKYIIYNTSKNISREISIQQLLDIIKLFNETLNQMKYSNNPKLMFELLIIQIITLNGDKKNTSNTSDNNINVTMTNKVKKSEILDESKIINQLDKNKIQNNQEKVLNKLEEVIENRVNNALSGFNKKNFISLKENISGINSLLLDEKYSKYASILLDATIKASGNNYIIYVCKDKNLSDLFNLNLVSLENIVSMYLNEKYKLISVDQNRWDIIKNEFNTKKKKYVFTEENYNIENIIKNINNDSKSYNDIEKLFGEIVEYKEEK